MEPLSLTLGAAAVMGLSFGAGPCNITCLPYLGPVFLAEQRRWQIVSLFSAGRLTGYALLGAIAGLLGQSLDTLLDASWGAWLLGLATVLMGVVLWRKGGSPACKSSAPHMSHRVEFIAAPTTRTTGGSLFFMGVGLALNPCTPLSALLLAAAASQSVILGCGLGLAFGLGAVVMPALLFGLLVAHFGNEVRVHLGRWQPHLPRAAALMLIMLGVATVMGWASV